MQYYLNERLGEFYRYAQEKAPSLYHQFVGRVKFEDKEGGGVTAVFSTPPEQWVSEEQLEEMRKVFDEFWSTPEK